MHHQDPGHATILPGLRSWQRQISANSQQGLPNLCTNVGQIYNITVQLAKMPAMPLDLSLGKNFLTWTMIVAGIHAEVALKVAKLSQF